MMRAFSATMILVFLHHSVLAQTITGITPGAGPIGTLVTITGTNLIGQSPIQIAGVPAIPISNNGSQLVAMVMPGASFGQVQVGTAVSAANFTVIAPYAPNTQQGGKLVGSGSIPPSWQGYPVAISADGNTAILGAYQDNGYQGGAWVFVRTNGQWSQQGPKLVGAGAIGPAYQGYGVAINADGNTILIGGPNDNSATGATWVFVRNNGIWTQQGDKIVGAGGNGTSGQGTKVALSADGNTAVVGGAGDNGTTGILGVIGGGGINGTGAVWAFSRSNGVWTQMGNKLVGSGETGSDNQGYAVAISADASTILIGGPDNDGAQGATWVFRQNNGVWTQQGNKLLGTGATGYQGFSVAISADGNTALIGGPFVSETNGASWVFVRNNGVWSQQSGMLLASGIASGSQQGIYVSLSADGNMALIGAHGASPNGAAIIFTRSNGIWTQQGGPFSGSDDVGGNQAVSVCLSADGNTAILGGDFDNNRTGAAWVFVHEMPQAKVSPTVQQVCTIKTSTPFSVSFSPDLSGIDSNLITYQWYQATSADYADATPIPGATAAVLAPNRTQAGSSYYYCIAQIPDGPGDTSNLAALTITTSAAIVPSISISAAATNICQGDAAVFTADAVNGGNAPVYQWTVNGANAGADSPSFSDEALVNGDIVSCMLTSNAACASSDSAGSNAIAVSVSAHANPTISIMASANDICSGNTVLFSASSTNEGTAPSYNWMVNGVNTGNNSPSFSTNSLSNGDSVDCTLISSATCAEKVTSPPIYMVIYTSPAVSFDPDTVYAGINGVQLSPSVGGAVSQYQWIPATALTNPAVADPVANPTGVTTYDLVVTSINGCADSAKITVWKTRPFVMPNAFTPNGDGHNDLFRIPPGVDLNLSTFEIFNRWGTKVFATQDLTQGWNGVAQGVPSPAGTYVYYITGSTPSGKQVSVKGTVILVR